jgi:DNA-binding transcriptional MerR regulator
MITKKYALVRVTTRKWRSINSAEAARRCGVHPGLIDRFVRLGLCEPTGWDNHGRQWLFEEDVVPLVRKIIRLRNELGINYAGIGVVLDLLGRIERLEARLAAAEAGDRHEGH